MTTASSNQERGFTWTEQHREECEARFVAGLPTRGQRNRYINGWANEAGRTVKPLASIRGEAAAQALREAVRRIYAQRRAPSPQAGDAGADGAAVHRTGAHGQPAGGSSLAPWDAGNSNPVKCVDSGVGA